MKTFIRFSVLLLIFISGCKKDDNNVTNPPNQQGTVTDIDGNIYHTITIGTQTWTVENLKVTKYRNGDAIPNLGGYEWRTTNIGAYCNYDNAQVATIYGRLYNGYAVNDPRDIAPVGWHIPSKIEWETLIQTLGIKSLIGGNLKEAGTAHWNSPNEGADNSSGFTALPGGYREKLDYYTDYFSGIGRYGNWWVKDVSPSTYNLYYFSLGYSSKEAYFDGNSFRPMSYGMSVRCVKD